LGRPEEGLVVLVVAAPFGGAGGGLARPDHLVLAGEGEVAEEVTHLAGVHVLGLEAREDV